MPVDTGFADSLSVASKALTSIDSAVDKTDKRFKSHVLIPKGPYCELNTKRLVEDEADYCYYYAGLHEDQSKSRDPNGYGQFSISSGVSDKAHRYALARKLGHPIPEGMDAGHMCHDSSGCKYSSRLCPHHACVREEHLDPQSPRVNTKNGNHSDGEELTALEMEIDEEADYHHWSPEVTAKIKLAWKVAEFLPSKIPLPSTMPKSSKEELRELLWDIAGHDMALERKSTVDDERIAWFASRCFAIPVGSPRTVSETRRDDYRLESSVQDTELPDYVEWRNRMWMRRARQQR